MNKITIGLLAMMCICTTHNATAGSCAAPTVTETPTDILFNLKSLATPACANAATADLLNWLKKAFPNGKIESRSDGEGYSISLTTTISPGLGDQNFSMRIDNSGHPNRRVLRIALHMNDSAHLSRSMLFDHWKLDTIREFVPSPHLRPGARQEALAVQNTPSQKMIITSSPQGNIVDLLYEDVNGN